MSRESKPTSAARGGEDRPRTKSLPQAGGALYMGVSYCIPQQDFPTLHWCLTGARVDGRLGSGCMALLRADMMGGHRQYHYDSIGFTTYTVAGSYTYTVPARTHQLKVQLWGAGGGRYVPCRGLGLVAGVLAIVCPATANAVSSLQWAPPGQERRVRWWWCVCGGPASGQARGAA